MASSCELVRKYYGVLPVSETSMEHLTSRLGFFAMLEGEFSTSIKPSTYYRRIWSVRLDDGYGDTETFELDIVGVYDKTSPTSHRYDYYYHQSGDACVYHFSSAYGYARGGE